MKETSEEVNVQYQLVMDPYSATTAQIAAILNLLGIQIPEKNYHVLTPVLQKLFVKCE